MYRGRFAPSPTGPLHAGSLVAALASWLDARAHAGAWLVRIEDVDTTRCKTAWTQKILQQLAHCGLHSDEPVMLQSARNSAYAAALEQLTAAGHTYGCSCSRSAIEQAQIKLGLTPHNRHEETPYPGTCRPDRWGSSPLTLRTVRFAVTPLLNPDIRDVQTAVVAYEYRNTATDTIVNWIDRRCGQQQQNVSREVGDFVLKRADGPWAYQLAVVVDDAAQGITQVVRGEDLLHATARQIVLQQRLGVATPQYLHTPLALAANGEKLSKQNSAAALDLTNPAAALCQALDTLGLQTAQSTHLHASELLAQAVHEWRGLYTTGG